MASYQHPTKMTARRRRLWYARRKALWVVALAAVVGGLALAQWLGLLGSRPPGDYQKYHDKTFPVVRVVDGDTIDVDAPDGPRRHTRIRLWGVDTPETAKQDAPTQHFADQADEFTSRACLGERVRLELDAGRTRGVHGRLLAYVYLPDGRMLNRLLVAEGYAYADPRFNHRRKTRFRRLQKQAKKAGLGLWKDVTRADLPYYYRKTLKLPEGRRQ